MEMTVPEVFALLSKEEAAYYNTTKGCWQDCATTDDDLIIPISPYLNGINSKLLDLDDYEEYTNQVTMYPWITLREYLKNPGEIRTLLQAAFLLDIAERNCIYLEPEVLDGIQKHKSPERLILYDIIYKKNFDALKALKDAQNSRIYRYLNVIVSRDAFIRV
jgi:hypothetical protein